MINIQVIGTKKCKDTQKVERFLKDRSIPFHFADLKERGISVGELTKIASGRDPEDLVNTKSEVYKKKNFICIISIICCKPFLHQYPSM